MYDRYTSITKINKITVMQNLLRFTVKELIFIHMKIRGKITRFSHKIILHNCQRNRELNRQPILFGLMDCDIVKASVTADIIPVNMGGYHRNMGSVVKLSTIVLIFATPRPVSIRTAFSIPQTVYQCVSSQCLNSLIA